ncbi:GH12 family glycosyl hydrolase domain-containing protein [Streptomyces sp. WI04-05B]|uniref:GH12 family glycosyl hydrolase domain-containing protein n=1 Tax=Streptomyces TaxID=1883 RepID=UPI0029AF4E76|nr:MULTISPECIES: endo-1,4-beta-glucanase [unclassified Streptomyces]MDX2544258.1 endo-1,4-beta-glucanase [Streptomyces sp. WI04-05B]MDX2584674.1 endo-1,4-beta-glucanase [Streptomyces sp. WI04-05A]MDX3749429.1 endo-1,4-beta-glucanase [Streptomyces sp. AK08-02]
MVTIKRLYRLPLLVGLASAAVAAPLLLAPGAAADAHSSAAARPSDICTAFNTVKVSPYYLNNNVWGAKGATGQECTWLNSYKSGKINWETSFDWKGGDPHGVKAYASAVLGWHWGWKDTTTKLPVRLNSGRKVTSSWNFNITQTTPTVMNVSYDLWFHQKSNPDWQDQPHDEMMVWLNRQNGAGPLGTKRETLTVGGVAWDLYVGKIVNTNSSWNVFSFVRKTNTNSQTTDLTALTNALVQRKLMANTNYLSSVEAGTEVFSGKGKLSTSSYSVTVG